MTGQEGQKLKKDNQERIGIKLEQDKKERTGLKLEQDKQAGKDRSQARTR